MKFYEERSEESFSQLYEPFKNYFIRVIKTKWPVNSEYTIEESIQETFMAIWEKIDQFDPKKSRFSSWATTILKNNLLFCSNHKKRTNKIIGYRYFPEISIEYFERSGSTQNEAFSSEDKPKDMDDLEEAILSLEDPVIKKPIWDKYILRKSYNQMQEETGIPKNTLKTRVRRAVQTIRGEPTDCRKRYGQGLTKPRLPL